MPRPNGDTPFWIKWAAKAAARVTRLGQEMRDEWQEGQAEAPLPDEPSPPDTSQAASPSACGDVLQVRRTASKEEIQQAWRRLIKENHPDRAAHLPEVRETELEKEAKRLNEAYENAMKER